MIRRTSTTTLAFSLILLGTALAVGADDNADSHASHAEHDAKKAIKWTGDPYLLWNDPVSGQSLAEVGQPVVVTYEGRELRFVTEDNARTFQADPDRYVARVDEQMIVQQAPLYPIKTCVVSDEALGGEMGEPIDFIYRNRLVRFCCKGCKRDFLKDPSAFVVKLDQAAAIEQREHYPLEKCLVSGEALGSMGKPVDRVFGNRLVRFCCGGCVKGFNKNPQKYLAQVPLPANAEAEHTANPKDGDAHEGHKHDHPR